MREDRLLDMITEERLSNMLEAALELSEDYCETLERQEQADSEVERAGLSKEQRKAVNRLVAAVNANGAAYGAVAYRLGLEDGIKLMAEVKAILQSDHLFRPEENMDMRGEE